MTFATAAQTSKATETPNSRSVVALAVSAAACLVFAALVYRDYRFNVAVPDKPTYVHETIRAQKLMLTISTIGLVAAVVFLRPALSWMKLHSFAVAYTVAASIVLTISWIVPSANGTLTSMTAALPLLVGAPATWFARNLYVDTSQS